MARVNWCRPSLPSKLAYLSGETGGGTAAAIDLQPGLLRHATPACLMSSWCKIKQSLVVEFCAACCSEASAEPTPHRILTLMPSKHGGVCSRGGR